jgi:hypothetical protein
MCLLPATNATSERAFSSLKRVKTCLRSSMSQSRLASLLVLHTHKDFTDQLDRQEIIKEFIQCHVHRQRDIATF